MKYFLPFGEWYCTGPYTGRQQLLHNVDRNCQRLKSLGVQQEKTRKPQTAVPQNLTNSSGLTCWVTQYLHLRRFEIQENMQAMDNHSLSPVNRRGKTSSWLKSCPQPPSASPQSMAVGVQGSMERERLIRDHIKPHIPTPLWAPQLHCSAHISNYIQNQTLEGFNKSQEFTVVQIFL